MLFVYSNCMTRRSSFASASVGANDEYPSIRPQGGTSLATDFEDTFRDSDSISASGRGSPGQARPRQSAAATCFITGQRLGGTRAKIGRRPCWRDRNASELDRLPEPRNVGNRLFRNDDGHFSDVTTQTRLADGRKTVGPCWFECEIMSSRAHVPKWPHEGFT